MKLMKALCSSMNICLLRIRESKTISLVPPCNFPWRIAWPPLVGLPLPEDTWPLSPTVPALSQRCRSFNRLVPGDEGLRCNLLPSRLQCPVYLATLFCICIKPRRLQRRVQTFTFIAESKNMCVQYS